MQKLQYINYIISTNYDKSYKVISVAETEGMRNKILLKNKIRIQTHVSRSPSTTEASCTREKKSWRQNFRLSHYTKFVAIFASIIATNILLHIAVIIEMPDTHTTKKKKHWHTRNKQEKKKPCKVDAEKCLWRAKNHPGQLMPPFPNQVCLCGLFETHALTGSRSPL